MDGVRGVGTASGCLFGLAYGDALGRPTEFLTVAEIDNGRDDCQLPG